MVFKLAILCTALFTGTLAASLTAPGNFQVKASYSTALLLTWDFDPNVYHYLLDIENSTVVLAGDSTAYNVTGLKPYTKYTFGLQKMSLFEAGEKVSITGQTCSGDPAIVTNVVTSVLSTESFSVNWSHPAEYNGPIGPTKLHLWTPNGMEQRKNVSHPTATETFSGLQPSLPYYVSLMATTQAEGQCSGRYGEAFLAGLVYMESKDQPIAPPVVTLKVLAATGLRAEWTQNDSSGPEILAYTYKLTKVSTGSLAQMGYLPVTARSVVLKNLVPFTDYALEVSANGIYTHGIARMTAKTAPGVPGNVQELKAAKKSTASLEATWKEPLNAPGDISSYRCVLYSGSFPTEWQTTKGTSVTFRGLDESNVYRVGVSATIDPIDQNIGGGTGPESLSNFVSFHEEEMPKLDPPVDASAKPAGSNAIALSWKPPTSSNVPVYYYKIIITDDEGVDRTEVAAEISTFRLLMGLKPETTYKIVMKSIGLQTESEPTRPVSATTSQGVPSVPQKVAAKFVSASQVQVSWIKPNYVGSGVTGYNVTMRQGGMELKSQDVENSATSCIITDLPEFAELIFVVAAKSKEGIGEAAFSNTLYTQAKAPPAPEIAQSVRQSLKISRPGGVKA